MVTADCIPLFTLLHYHQLITFAVGLQIERFVGFVWNLLNHRLIDMLYCGCRISWIVLLFVA